MKRNEFILLAASWVSGVLLLGCSADQQKSDLAKVTYTCSMHPQIVQNKPGTCPICGMDLVVVVNSTSGATITLGPSQMALANISVRPVGKGMMTHSKPLNGRLVVNPERTTVVSSRIAGRLELLYVRETGVRIAQGQPLYKIYSEELAALQQEYLLAHEQVIQFPLDSRFAAIEKASIQKLKRYDQSASDIENLNPTKKQEPYVLYRAPMSGTVADVGVFEGQYVSEGSPILRIENYSTLWVEADIYPEEARWVGKGKKVEVQIPGSEGDAVPMTIDFITPVIESAGQVVRVRGTIANSTGQWQPGMQAQILLPVEGKTDAITLPVDAVIRDSHGAQVWVQTKPGTFTARSVGLGIENDKQVEIIHGLSEEDKVVATGAYLLYSEYILKKGADPMAAHQHN
ncbi:Cu(I)/Ag(I) efflux system membrane fusion protein [Dyadobacter jejuensis]|uniref:Cu(I)/Ag(I) efflux system membrane fusion protein n=1 Tax=Dyadobacter jejuensis TaxID=1082580 RepID=A0A316AMJ9_9BACT|nr:efflux RND transporter periplasmic adaptor subunit [Dyadobacter jejuensis]PWJ58668.1 Cu(I)/Ag(I) efflux system membrane fusion protein [Dyadobacter jejuensis]